MPARGVADAPAAPPGTVPSARARPPPDGTGARVVEGPAAAPGPGPGACGLAIAVGVLAGSAAPMALPALPAAATMDAAAALAVALLLALALASLRARGRVGSTAAVAGPWPAAAAALLLAIAVAVLAFVATSMRAGARLAERLPAALEGRDLVVRGTVASLPRVSIDGVRFVFETEAATLDGAAVALPPRLWLGWWRGFEDDALLAAPAETVRAGQRWRLTVRLRRPHGVLNPHGFDTERWLFEQGIGALGSVRATAAAAAAPARLADAAAHPVQRLRQAVRDRIAATVDDPRAAGVLAALAVGDQGAIDGDDWELFRTTGVAHLMAISGLHVTMLAWLGGAAAAALWRRHPRAPLWLPVPQAARLAALATAASYALLAGWGVPAQRTVGMIAVVVALRLAGVRWPAPAVLLAAAAAVVAGDPWALGQPGFWLSFVAVALLMTAGPATAHAAAPAGAAGPGTLGALAATPSARDPGPALPAASAARGWGTFVGPAAPPALAAWRARLGAAAASGWRTQWVATVGLAPLSMVFFQQVSLVGLPANLAAIPLVTLAVTPLALAGIVAPPLWHAAAALLQALSALLQALAGLPGALWTAAAAPGWAALLGVMAGALAVAPLPPRLRWLALPLALPLLAPPVERPPAGRFEAVAADVGQGTAVLVRTRGHLLVYDSGPGWSARGDAGQRVLVPLLRARGERRIDRLVLSHRDSDHVGGAASLAAALPVAQWWTTLPPTHPLRRSAEAAGAVHRPCRAGEGWTWDGVRFEIVHPLAEALAADAAAAAAGDGRGGGARANALSCVLRVADAHGGSLLLTGDIEAAQEAALVARAGAAALASTVLLVPHHGSRTSSTPALLDAVRPRQAVVQAAYRSRFGHPAPAVVARYAERGIALARSDACGAWLRAADGTAACERQRRRRYWHHGGGPVAGETTP